LGTPYISELNNEIHHSRKQSVHQWRDENPTPEKLNLDISGTYSLSLFLYIK